MSWHLRWAWRRTAELQEVRGMNAHDPNSLTQSSKYCSPSTPGETKRVVFRGCPLASCLASRCSVKVDVDGAGCRPNTTNNTRRVPRCVTLLSKSSRRPAVGAVVAARPSPRRAPAVAVSHDLLAILGAGAATSSSSPSPCRPRTRTISTALSTRSLFFCRASTGELDGSVTNHRGGSLRRVCQVVGPGRDAKLGLCSPRSRPRTVGADQREGPRPGPVVRGALTEDR